MSVGLFIGLTCFGVFVGVMMGFFGVGGGGFVVPFLVRIAGLSWDQAIALSLAQMVPTGALGAWRRWRQGETHLRLALISLGGSIPGAWIGRTIVRALGERGTVEVAGFRINILDTSLTAGFVAFLWWMGMRMWKDAAIPPAPRGVAAEPSEAGAEGRDEAGGSGEDYPVPPFEAWLLGLGVGTVSALLGIGGGFFFVPVAVERFGLPVSLAVGASLLQIPVTATVGAALYLSVEGTPYLWLVPLMLGSSFGVVQGVALSKRFDNSQLKRIMAGMLVGVSVFLAVSWFGDVK